MQIEIQIKNKIARTVSPLPIVCGNSDYSVVFDFDDEWEKTTKTARFKLDSETFVDVLFDGTTCSVPVIDDAEHVEIGVFAGDLRTTTPAYVRCLKSIRSADGPPAGPIPSVYDQLIEKLNSLELAGGTSGKDGITPTIGENGNWYLGTEDTGKPSRGEKGDKGDTGADGADGADGTSVTVATVTESTADGGANIVTFTDGTTLTVRNGSKGSTGAAGKDGADGAKGADGKTPIKGTDYFTAADKAEIVAAVVAALPKYGGTAEGGTA